MKNKIRDYLQNYCLGAEHSITSEELQFHLECDGQEIRAYVNELRCEGVPICSWSKGYYYAAKDAEVEKTIAQLQGRVNKINEAIDGLQMGRNKMRLRCPVLVNITCGYITKNLKENIRMKFSVKKFERFAKKYGYANGKQVMNELGCSDDEYKDICELGYIGCDWVSELFNRFGEDALYYFLSVDEELYA
jgi:biotin operon repressor